MAGVNTTDPLARSVHGTNPQNLIEKILRLRIYDSFYWKAHCFALTAESLLEKAVDLDYIGSAIGAHRKPTPFICLTLKLLQIQPDKDVVIEYIKNEDYKYVRALGALYLRLVGRPLDIYQYLEPLYNDYRKLRVRTTDGWELTHMDEFIDLLLHSDFALGIALPRLPKRHTLEEAGYIQPRTSALDEELADLETQEGQIAAEADDNEKERKPTHPSDSVDDKRRKRNRSSKAHHTHNKHRSRSNSSNSEDDVHVKPDKNSVEYWNAQRAKLGLKPLK